MTRIDTNPTDFDDWTSLHGLLGAAFAPEVGHVDPPPSFLELGPEEIAQKAVVEDMFLARDPLSGCLFGKPHGNVYYLGKWAVLPDMQGKGLSRALLDAATQRALELGHTTLQLGTRVELLDNHRIFRALGFHLAYADRHPGYTRPTAFVFERSLELKRQFE